MSKSLHLGIINRGLVILKKKEPFLLWLRSLPDPMEEMTLAEANVDPMSLLIPDFEEAKEAEAFIKERFEKLWGFEMERWWEDNEDWEKNLTWKKFLEWFEIETSCIVWDLGAGVIERTDDEIVL